MNQWLNPIWENQFMRYLIIGLASILTLVRCCYEVDCEQESLNFAVVSFSPSEMDTLIFRKYEAKSNFRSLKDTMQITHINVLNPVIKGDTVAFLMSPYDSSYIKFQLRAGHDYKILIPATGKVQELLKSMKRRRRKELFYSWWKSKLLQLYNWIQSWWKGR